MAKKKEILFFHLQIKDEAFVAVKVTKQRKIQVVWGPDS